MKYNPSIVLAFFSECGLPYATPEFQFHPDRKWRFDFAFPAQLVALEVDGGIWVAGKHSRGAGIKKDWEKRNAAAVLGWRILYVEPKDLCTAETARMITDALTKRLMRPRASARIQLGEQDAQRMVFIRESVARHFGISVANLDSRGRHYRIADPRALAIALCMHCATSATLSCVGNTFGGRDHGTVLHIRKSFRDRLETEPGTKQLFEKFLDLVKQHFPDE